jgi:Xaa-Pro aminopeptidase
MTDEIEARRSAALADAQAKAAALFAEIEGQGLLRPGGSETTISKDIFRLSRDRFNAGRHWHKRVIRVGVNSALPYAAEPPERIIQEDDIVYVDLGPIFEEWEADFGRTFVIGSDPRKQQLVREAETGFKEGKAYFQSKPDITGAELYAKAVEIAARGGWDFGNVHAGHTVGEFPHEKIDGDRITLYIHPENNQALRSLNAEGKQRHWILEMHLVDKDKRYGAFFEELLTVG